MIEASVNIHPRLRALINPRVLAEVEGRLAEGAADDHRNSREYRQYLEMHAAHIISEATRRGQSNFVPEGSAA